MVARSADSLVKMTAASMAEHWDMRRDILSENQLAEWKVVHLDHQMEYLRAGLMVWKMES